VNSVHAFAQSSIGTWFTTFMGIIFAVCLFFFLKNRRHLASEHKLESLVSRESSFLFNNLILLAACFTVLWGTLFPLLSEWVQGTKITVGPPFFNRVMVPIALLLLILTGVGPLLAWRKTSVESLKRNFTVPVIFSVLVGIGLIFINVRPWTSVSVFYSWSALVLGTLVAVTICAEFLRGARVIASHTGENLAAAVVHLTRRNTRRYGGYVVHFGVVLVVLGLAGSAFNRDNEQELGMGERMTLGPYTLICQSYTQDDNDNYQSESAIVDVYRGNDKITTLYPERRFYKANQQPATIVANHSTPIEDVYLVYAGSNPANDRPIIRAYLNPLVMWVWIGWLVLVAGTGLALVPNMQAAELKQRQREVAVAMEAGD